MRYRVTIPTEHPIKASNRSKSRFSGPLSLPKYPNQSQSEVILDQFRRSIENCSKKCFSFSFSRDDLLTSSYTLISANDEMSSPSEDRSPHYKLAWGILAGIIPLTLVKLIYIKKYHRWVLQLYLGQLSLNYYFKIFKNRLWGYQCWHNKMESALVVS